MKKALLKKIYPKYLLIFLPFILVFVLLFLVIADLTLSFLVQRSVINQIPFSVKQEAKIPYIKTGFVPQISAKGAIIMDADSKVVLYSKNPALRFSTASTAKIMTAITALDYFKPDDILTVKQATNEGSTLGFWQGEKFTLESLLYAMLLPSANDAALAISQNYPSGQKLFVEKMNNKASSFKLSNTHYSDSSGLTDAGDYTTPFDLARLASFAVSNPEFKKIIATKQTIIYDTYGNSYNLENLNKLLGVDGVNGVKTGFTEEAGQVLVTSKNEKGKTIIIVVMGSEDRFEDTRKLLNLINNNLTYLSIRP